MGFPGRRSARKSKTPPGATKRKQPSAAKLVGTFSPKDPVDQAVVNEPTFEQASLMIYLSGSIKKGSVDNRSDEHFWTEDRETQLVRGIKVGEVQTLNPAKSRIQRNDYYSNFGCDLHLVATSDLVLVDARTEKGVGVGAEMMFAKSQGIPVLTICPRNSSYRRDYIPDVFGEDLYDWIHPFVFGLSDLIVDDLQSAIDAINDHGIDGLRAKIGAPIEAAIDYYRQVCDTSVLD